MTQGLRWYLTSIGTAFIPSGIQMVLFSWLVAVHLGESAQRLGYAQMASQLPMLLLILWGGFFGDRLDQRRWLMKLQLAMALPPILLLLVIYNGHLTYPVMLGWGFLLGVVMAFAQPARDALLNRVAGSDIQRVVTLLVGIQFGGQIVGFGIGFSADHIGPMPILFLQALFLCVAAFATYKIQGISPQTPRSQSSVGTQIREGVALAWHTPVIRAALIQTFAVGIFFAGAYMVVLPIMVRDLYAGGAAGIAGAFAANMLGTCTVIVYLMRIGGLQSPGRALILVGALSSGVLGLLYFDLPQWGFYAVIYLWGMCGGINMTMSRSMVQEAAPASHRARVLSVYSLGMMGGMPIGSLLLGWVVDIFGVQTAVLVPACGMFLVCVYLRLGTTLWTVQRPGQMA